GARGAHPCAARLRPFQSRRNTRRTHSGCVFRRCPRASGACVRGKTARTPRRRKRGRGDRTQISKKIVERSMSTDARRFEDATCGPFKVHSLILSPDADPIIGTVSWDPLRSLWNGGMMLASLILGPIFFTWNAFGIFVILLAITMCTGHS